jgi:hypothetical protein
VTWWEGNKWNKLVVGFVNIFGIIHWHVHRLLAWRVFCKGTVKWKWLATSHTTVICAFCKECTETCLILCYGTTNTSRTTGCYYFCTELTQMQGYCRCCAVPCLTLQCLELRCNECGCCDMTWHDMTWHSWRLKLNTFCYQNLSFSVLVGRDRDIWNRRQWNKQLCMLL